MTSRRYRFTSVPERHLRARRQEHGTLYRQLLAQGFTAEDIAAAENSRPGLRRIGLALVTQDGATDPLVGVAYGGDFRAEEEHGLPQINRGLAAGEHKKRILTGEVDGRWYLGLHADQGLHRWQPEETLARQATEAHERSAREAEWAADRRDRTLLVPQLREDIRGAGIEGPLPRTKPELQAMHRRVVRHLPEFTDVGEFHYGDTLIYLAHQPILIAALRLLADSGKHLRMGGSGSPFGTGATIYDERDLTGDQIESARARADYIARMTKKAEPLRAALNTRGQVYALTPGRIQDGVDMFYLNYSPRGHAQQFGWYSLAQLAEHHANGTWPMQR
jgi:hypothetical protein